jgi:cell division protein ZapA
VAQVDVTVNGQTYRVACDDGQEEHVSHLAEYLDHRVGELVKGVGQVGESRLLLLAALLVIDELAEADHVADGLRGQLEEAAAAAERSAGDAAQASENTMNRLAERLENIAGDLGST